MTKIVAHPRVAYAMAAARLEAACERGESEHPHLAAPDGTVAVQIDDLRALLNEESRLRDFIALAKAEWTCCWYGSDPGRGSSIWTVNKHGARSEMVAHFGDAEGVHDAVRTIVSMHNAALAQVPA